MKDTAPIADIESVKDETATATKATATKSKAKAAKIPPKSGEVLVTYNPSASPSFFLAQKCSASLFVEKSGQKKADLLTLTVEVGTQAMPVEHWELWEKMRDENIGIVPSLFSIGAIKLSAETTDISKLDQVVALDIVRTTRDPGLLAKWAGMYEKLGPGVQRAMFDQQEALKDTAPVKKFLFGRQVG